MWWTFIYGNGGNTASVTYVFKEQISNGYISSDLRTSIDYNFGSSATNAINLIFANSNKLTETCTSTRILYGGEGYDVSDSVSLHPSIACGATITTITYSALPSAGVIDPSTVGTSTYTGALELPNDTLVCKGTSYYAIFYYDGTNWVYRTSSDGTTWGASNTIAAHVSFGLGVGCSGNNVAYIRIDSSTGKLDWRNGTIGSTITWNAGEAQFTAAHTSGIERPSLVYDSNGNPWFSFGSQDGSGTCYVEVWEHPSTGLVNRNLGVSTPSSCSSATTDMVQLNSGEVAVVYSFDFGTGHAISTNFWSGSSWERQLPLPGLRTPYSRATASISLTWFIARRITLLTTYTTLLSHREVRGLRRTR